MHGMLAYMIFKNPLRYGVLNFATVGTLATFVTYLSLLRIRGKSYEISTLCKACWTFPRF